MIRTILVSVLALVLFTAAPAAAGDQPIPNTNFVIFVPDNFKLEGNADLLTAESPDKTAAFLWALAPATELDKATAGLTALMANIVTDIKEGKPAKKKINGMPALVLPSTGIEKATKAPVSLMTVLVEQDGKVLITIGVVHTAKKAQHKGTADKVFGGIRKK